MSPRFVLGRENVPRVAEVVNRSLKADCTDFTNAVCHSKFFLHVYACSLGLFVFYLGGFGQNEYGGAEQVTRNFYLYAKN